MFVCLRWIWKLMVAICNPQLAYTGYKKQDGYQSGQYWILKTLFLIMWYIKIVYVRSTFAVSPSIYMKKLVFIIFLYLFIHVSMTSLL